MAWITKNSGTMEVERRDTPYLDRALKDKLEPIVGRYPTRQAASLPVLHALQEEHGWLPFQAIEEAGDFLDTPASTMLDTASFYEEFWLQPKGKYVIWVCQSISCEIMRHDRIIDAITDKLGIEPGETTGDGRFTLMHVECIGACGGAPAALVNERLHENLTPENVGDILDQLP